MHDSKLRRTHLAVSNLAGYSSPRRLWAHKSRSFGLVSIQQLNESTDASSCSQIVTFVRYIKEGAIKGEFLSRSSLETTTKAVDVIEKVSEVFEEHGLKWENLCGICTDGGSKKWLPETCSR